MDHVKQCNQAEAEFWRKNEGYQTRNSDKLLQFDCGGQVREIEAFVPTI
jgi:L-galactono-1,4-lactone dehydrogenase